MITSKILRIENVLKKNPLTNVNDVEFLFLWDEIMIKEWTHLYDSQKLKEITIP